MRGRDVSRKEGKREKRRGRYIYIYIRARYSEAGSKLSPRKDYGRCLGSRFKLQPGRWCLPPLPPDHLDPLFHSKLRPSPRHAIRTPSESPPRLKIKDRGAYSTLCLGPGKKILGAYSGPGTTGRNENVERRVPTRIFQPFLAYGHANCFNCKGNVTTPRRMGAFLTWQKDLGHLALSGSCCSCCTCETFGFPKY